MTTHAEVDALRKMKGVKSRKMKKLCLISLAYNGNEYQMSKPCKNCCRSMLDMGIEWIYWFDRDGIWHMDRVHAIYDTAILSSGDRFHIS